MFYVPFWGWPNAGMWEVGTVHLISCVVVVNVELVMDARSITWHLLLLVAFSIGSSFLFTWMIDLDKTVPYYSALSYALSQAAGMNFMIVSFYLLSSVQS